MKFATRFVTCGVIFVIRFNYHIERCGKRHASAEKAGSGFPVEIKGGSGDPQPHTSGATG
jgi:hypothetical protein